MPMTMPMLVVPIDFVACRYLVVLRNRLATARLLVVVSTLVLTIVSGRLATLVIVSGIAALVVVEDSSLNLIVVPALLDGIAAIGIVLVGQSQCSRATE